MVVWSAGLWLTIGSVCVCVCVCVRVLWGPSDGCMICRSVANDRFSVWKLGITHVLNAAHGKMHSQGCHRFYGSTVEYYGVPADDSPSFNLSVYFHPCADYIKEVLSSPGGKTVSGFTQGLNFLKRCFTVMMPYRRTLFCLNGTFDWMLLCGSKDGSSMAGVTKFSPGGPVSCRV